MKHRYDTLLKHSLPRYVLVGGVGFIIDAGILMLLHYQAGWDVMPARFASFSIAVTATWLLNRLFTFAKSRTQRILTEWLRYALVNAVGGGLNLTVFAAMIYWRHGLFGEPMTAIVIAALISLTFTYSANRWLVFRVTTAPE